MLRRREQARDTIELFKQLNGGEKHLKAMADGIITTLIVLHKLSKRVVDSVLKVGTGCIKRSRVGKTKQTDHVHLN